MSAHIPLGGLEFKAEDFEEKIEHAYRTRAAQQLAQIITNEANRLLRERLEKVTKVYGEPQDDFGVMYWIDDEDQLDPTHSARLVCVDEIKK